jgi:hypothetical protein
VSAVFRTEGPLSEDVAHLYVARPEDGAVAAGVRRGNYVALIGARKMGKTSLLLRQRRQLLDAGHVAVYVDLSPPKDKDQEQWYGYLQSVIQEQLERAAPDISVSPMGDQLDFRAALKQICMDLAPARQIVILLDEVRAVPPPVADLFFSTIRTVFNEGMGISPALRRCVFVMAGTFVPDDLVIDPSVSPFNVAKRIYMSDADRDGCGKLVENLERGGLSPSGEIVDRIYDWTGGHLYFTQRLCSIIEEREAAHLSDQAVDRAAAVVGSDENIARVYEQLREDDDARRALRRRVMRSKGPFGDEPLQFNRASSLVARLELLGAVKCDAAGNCVVRNRIYEQALEQYFAGTSHLKKRSTSSPRSSSFWDRLAELSKGVLDNVLATIVLAIGATVIGHLGGFLQDQGTRLVFIVISMAIILVAMVGYALWERRVR